MSEPALKCENIASFKQINTLKLFIAFKMAYFCYFSFGENLDFPDFLQKKFYNINYRTGRFQTLTLNHLFKRKKRCDFYSVLRRIGKKY